MKINMICGFWLMSLVVAFALTPEEMSEDLQKVFVRSEEDEQRLIEFVRANPAVDFFTYLVKDERGGGQSMLLYATLRDYVELLKAIEETHYLSELDPPKYQSVLRNAITFNSTNSVVFLATIPYWLKDAPPGYSSVVQIYQSPMKNRTDYLLDEGGDINAREGMFNLTLMDLVTRRSFNDYEMVRKRGGLFDFNNSVDIKESVRDAAIAKYGSQRIKVYGKRVEMPSGVVVHYAVTNRPEAEAFYKRQREKVEQSGKQWEPDSKRKQTIFDDINEFLHLPEDMQDLLNEQIKLVGSNCFGTVIVECHPYSEQGIIEYIEPALRTNQLVGIYVYPLDAPVSKEPPRRDYLPCLPPPAKR